MKLAFVSDLHLGQREPEQRSVLAGPSPWRDALADRLARFSAGEPVTLVACGDLLDFSLAWVRDAVADLTDLLGALPMVGRLLWVVGNHDHKAWTLHRDMRAIVEPLARGDLPAPGGVYRATAEPEPCAWLPVVHAGDRTVPVELAYPALTLTFDDPRRPPGDRRVLLHATHGHLAAGSVYTILSRILAPQVGQESAASRAEVNAAVVELVYWWVAELGAGLGAQGVAERLLLDLKRGDDSLARRLVEQAVGQADLPAALRGTVVRALCERLRGAIEDTPLDRAGARHAAVESTRAGLLAWRDLARLPRAARTILVTGHTHVADLWPGPGGITGYNLGSWLEEGGRKPEAQVVTVAVGPAGLDVGWHRIQG